MPATGHSTYSLFILEIILELRLPFNASSISLSTLRALLAVLTSTVYLGSLNGEKSGPIGYKLDARAGAEQQRRM